MAMLDLKVIIAMAADLLIVLSDLVKSNVSGRG